MISLTFGNSLKFGQDSYHTSKGRYLPPPRERKHPKHRLYHTHQSIKKGLQRAPRTREHHHGWRSNKGPQLQFSTPIKVERRDTCFNMISSSHKSAIYMVPRPNLGDDSIFIPLCLVHSVEAYFPRNQPSLWALVPIVATPLGIEKFESNVFHLLNLTKTFLIWFCTHFH